MLGGARIPQYLFPNPEEFFKSTEALLKSTQDKTIQAEAQFYREIDFAPSDDAIKVHEWNWKDPDINNIRLMQVTASNTSYEIKVIIDPAPTDS